MGMEYMGADKHKAYLFAYKQDKLVAGPNIEITPNEDGKTATISASGGEGTVTDVLVDGVSVVNQDGEAEFSTMTGATSQMAGEGGLVPTPAIADRNKYLKGDGTWGEVSTVGDLEDLGDVTITNPADGESLVYDADNDEWVNREIGGAVDDIVMNGQSIVSNKVARFQNYVELTQSEYDALPDSKLTDGILYCIKDTGIVEGEKFAPVIYSLEEREIGVWTDGKPLYQKTINCGALPNNTAILTPIGVSGIEDVKSMCGIAISHSVNVCFPIPSSTSSYIVSINYQSSSNNIEIRTTNDRSAYNAYVTIQYTKTADVPGSGNWTTEGVPTHHYSTDEKVIGTWIDGKPLYEKTIDCGALPNATTKNIEHRISDLDFIVSANGTSFNGSQHFVIPFVNDGIIGSQVLLFVTATDIVLRTSVDRSAFTKTFVTLQYTKTTD